MAYNKADWECVDGSLIKMTDILLTQTDLDVLVRISNVMKNAY